MPDRTKLICTKSLDWVPFAQGDSIIEVGKTVAGSSRDRQTKQTRADDRTGRATKSRADHRMDIFADAIAQVEEDEKRNTGFKLSGQGKMMGRIGGKTRSLKAQEPFFSA